MCWIEYRNSFPIIYILPQTFVLWKHDWNDRSTLVLFNTPNHAKYQTAKLPYKWSNVSGYYTFRRKDSTPAALIWQCINIILYSGFVDCSTMVDVGWILILIHLHSRAVLQMNPRGVAWRPMLILLVRIAARRKSISWVIKQSWLGNPPFWARATSTIE